MAGQICQKFSFTSVLLCLSIIFYFAGKRCRIVFADFQLHMVDVRTFEAFVDTHDDGQYFFANLIVSEVLWVAVDLALA